MAARRPGRYQKGTALAATIARRKQAFALICEGKRRCEVAAAIGATRSNVCNDFCWMFEQTGARTMAQCVYLVVTQGGYDAVLGQVQQVHEVRTPEEVRAVRHANDRRWRERQQQQEQRL